MNSWTLLIEVSSDRNISIYLLCGSHKTKIKSDGLQEFIIWIFLVLYLPCHDSIEYFLVQELLSFEFILYINVFVVGPKRERNVLEWVGPQRDLYFF